MGSALERFDRVRQYEASELQRQTSPFKRASLGALSRFLGSIPLTARFNTSAPPHLSNILSIVIDFKLPGRVVW